MITLTKRRACLAHHVGSKCPISHIGVLWQGCESLHPHILNVFLKECLSKASHASPLIPVRRRQPRIAPHHIAAQLCMCYSKNVLQQLRPNATALVFWAACKLSEAGRRNGPVRVGQRFLEYGYDCDWLVAGGQECAVVKTQVVLCEANMRHRMVWPEHGVSQWNGLVSCDAPEFRFAHRFK